VQRVAALDLPTPFNGTLEAASIPRTADVVAAAKALCGTGATPAAAAPGGAAQE
jgi:pyruvate dehydrogenase E1 component beta subunit